MAKINIPFNGTDYLIEESALTSATTELQSHLQTEMSGSGAVIKLGGNTYNVDSTKLTNERNTLVSHLGTIAGTSSKVVVNGVEYGVDSSKMSVTMAELTTTFNTLSGGTEPSDPPVVMRAAGLYETGTDTMVASWDELLNEGAFVVNNGTVTVGTTGGGALPDINEYGFYYGALYSMSMDGMTLGLVFNNDGSFLIYNDGVQNNAFPAGSAIYSSYAIDLNVLDCGICPISNDGTSITVNGMGQFNLSGTPGTPYVIVGDLVLPNDNSIVIIPDDAFKEQSSLTSITIPDSVTGIGSYAFHMCDNLTSVVIGNGTTTIGSYAFHMCDNLTSVVIGNGTTTIGSCAFRKCSKLNSIVIGASVTSIGNDAFWECTSLTSVVIPDSVTSIGYAAFAYCDKLNIYCEATSKPSGWATNWNPNNRPVTWGYKA